MHNIIPYNLNPQTDKITNSSARQIIHTHSNNRNMKNLGCLIIIMGLSIFASLPLHAKESHADNYKTSSQNWPMPPSGPKAVKGKKILYVAMDLANGGILGVAEGLEEAAKEINWQLIIRNASGDNAKVEDILKNALNQNLDGLILGGFNAVNFNKELKALSQQNIKIIGWHSGATPGPLKGTPVLTNITTEPAQVAKYAAGEVNGKKEPGYLEDDEVPNDSVFYDCSLYGC